MIFTIFKKELKDTLRDRRTIIAMIVIPVLVFPLILGLATQISKSFTEDQKEETLTIALIGENHSNRFVTAFDAIPDSLGPKKLIFKDDTSGIRNLIEKDSVQLAIQIPADYDKQLDAGASVPIKIFLKETNIGHKSRIQNYLNIIESQALQQRMAKLDIDAATIEPLRETFVNLSTSKEMIGKIAGGFLPYLFIIFGFIGCLYPAIDLFTGEKERKTLETLLTTPVQRWKILIGKMMVVVLSGIAAASFALLGLFLSLNVFELVPNAQIMGVVNSILSLPFILSLYILLIPLTVFFAGVMIPVTIYAKSFKEAQSILTPVNFVIILPAMIGFIPGIELDGVTALIPIVNIVLATKELVAGTLSFGLMALVFAVMFAFAVLAVIISYKRFEKESNVIS
ncbi:MAG: ABC transporter permease [Bacteroidota bacterium]